MARQLLLLAALTAPFAVVGAWPVVWTVAGLAAGGALTTFIYERRTT